VRVIAGRLRGRRVHAPRSDTVRPTYDRVRESIFAVLEPDIEEASVLDLFAGSGILGIESLSRGARRVTFVERNRQVLAVVERNVRELGLADQSRLICGDALRLLGGTLPGTPFDIVFVDPPYAERIAPKVLGLLGRWAGLAAGGSVVVEHGRSESLAEHYGGLIRRRTKRYGDTDVDIYQARCDQPTAREVE
jgi:16S rRNA (guanine(966)-N(2))-methyltransferase RsmD